MWDGVDTMKDEGGGFNLPRKVFSFGSPSGHHSKLAPYPGIHYCAKAWKVSSDFLSDALAWVPPLDAQSS